MKKLFKEAFLGENRRSFPGVVLLDIPRLKQRFQLEINVFELRWIDGKSRGEIILRSKGLFKTDQLLSFVAVQGHFCLIKKGW